MQNLWHVTIDDLVHIFRNGLIDLIPTFERAKINWRSDPYDDFDRIAEALYDSIVRDSVANGTDVENAISIARYAMLGPGKTCSRILVNDVRQGLALLDLVTNQQPFDTIELVKLGPEGEESREAGTVPYEGATFACELRYPDGGSPRLIRELDVEL